jgi:hypothetical protein
VAAFDLETEEWKKPVVEDPEEGLLWQIALVELRGARSMVLGHRARRTYGSWLFPRRVSGSRST